jgi:hypothetical protein
MTIRVGRYNSKKFFNTHQGLVSFNFNVPYNTYELACSDFLYNRGEKRNQMIPSCPQTARLRIRQVQSFRLRMRGEDDSIPSCIFREWPSPI